MAENPVPVTEEGGRNRRSLANLLISPAGQIRLIFVLPVLGLAAVGFLHWALWIVIDDRLGSLREGANPAQVASIDSLLHATSHIFILGFGFTITCAVMVAVFGLLISHRFYGPLVPILRSVRAMTNGDFSARIHLRKGDELRELASALNTLAETLGQGRKG